MYVICMCCFCAPVHAQRYDRLLDDHWFTAVDSFRADAFAGFQQTGYSTRSWKRVSVPHNWDDYGGYVRLLHGNRHGYAFYRKTFSVRKHIDRRLFLWFEGVSSYATVWLNGKKVGYHAGGRTSFTIDITDDINKDGTQNVLAVRVDHPSAIRDLPWVCGGCSDEPGFSEGSQPMGIFRPVHLVETGLVRVQPFGVHIWNDTTVCEKKATLYLETEIKNYDNSTQQVLLTNRLIDRNGKTIATAQKHLQLSGGEVVTISQQMDHLTNIQLWSLEHPYLYHMVTEVKASNARSDSVSTAYGIRWISWPIGKEKSSGQFLLNGKPVFINGIAEYEHALGQSHAFSAEEIKSRAMMIAGAGFNAFRDAHQPHNLLYQKYWDSLGVLWWPQFSAHIWFDSPAFKRNFITLLKDWVRERRNSPSVILWGLQNESHLPADFARKCSDIIRKLDPTASSQRLITTCNGGEGTDWDVPQNWTGTYGGDPATYANDLKKQLLVGEYGGWRTIGLHEEYPDSGSKLNSENKWCALVEQKIRLAESVRGSVCGHFFWLFNSHDNPGRVQSGEGYRELDAIGPVNYKGLLTSWEEPTDGYYLFRANYSCAVSSPMVYIVSHTWPDRWLKAGIKKNIDIYSNCDSVELFNDVGGSSLGMKINPGRGRHFIWKDVFVRYNVLYAVGYVRGKVAARDTVLLHHLPESPHFRKLYFIKKEDIIQPGRGYRYIYRVNCGGPDYKDTYGNVWKADRQLTDSGCWGSQSWTKDYPGIPSFFASQRRITDPIRNTYNWPLFQSFRYGRDKLTYTFPLPDGRYRVELYFAEPWWGTGGSEDCSGFRSFDVSINGKTMLRDFDLWKIAGAHAAVKRIFNVQATGGSITISFPNTESGQAVISAVAIASGNVEAKTAPSSKPVIDVLGSNNFLLEDWMDTGDTCYRNDHTTFSALSPKLFGAQWLCGYKQKQNGCVKIKANEKATLYIGINIADSSLPLLPGFTNTKAFIETDEEGGNKLDIYERTLGKNDTLCLNPGKNGMSNYIIAAKPFSSLQPAYDFKPIMTYTALTASHNEGFIKSHVDNRESLELVKSNATVSWKIKLGIAAYYSATVKYANRSQIPVQAHWQLLSTDGLTVDSGTLLLQPSRKGKWSSMDWRTKSMINAGNYTLSLEIVNKNPTDIYISSLGVR